jgi:hypothetical protein
LPTSETVSVGGLTVKAPRAGSPFVSPRYLSLSAPFVLGVIVVELPKTPNTSPERDWSFFQNLLGANDVHP